MRTLLLVCSILPALLYAQDRFPTIQGETANGTSVTIPRTGDGPWTVVGLAYSQKATPLLEAWYEPAYLRFVAKHGLFASAYEAEVYFVPLFVGVNKAAYEPSMKKFRKSAEPAIVAGDLVIAIAAKQLVGAVISCKCVIVIDFIFSVSSSPANKI